MCKLAKYVRNCVVFWKNLHSWQKFYTTAGRDGRDKFQVWFKSGQSDQGHQGEGQQGEGEVKAETENPMEVVELRDGTLRGRKGIMKPSKEYVRMKDDDDLYL